MKAAPAPRPAQEAHDPLMETSLAFSPFRLLPTLDELRLVVDALDEDDTFAFACA